MRRPGLWIAIGLTLAVVGLLVAWYGLELGRGLPVRDPGSKAIRGIPPVGFGLTLGGLVLAAIAFAVDRKRAELTRGDRLVGHWRVGLLDWDGFRRRDAGRDGLFSSLRNRLRLPAELPPEGMEIRIGPDAMLVGDGCYGLGYFASRGKLVEVALLEGRPAMLEFTTHQPGKNSRIAVFRVPVPDMARDQARAVVDHFGRTIDPARRDTIRGHFANHFQAATGDAGEAEVARARERNRTWTGAGIALFLVGGLILFISRIKTPGPNADQTGIMVLTIGGGIAAVVGLACLAIAMLGRR